MGIETYAGTQLGAIKYRRCKAVTISNELGTLPTINFAEEDVIKVDDLNAIKTYAGAINEQLTNDNLNTTFDLIHPETLQPLGKTATYTDVSIMLRSLYHFLALRRDQAV